MTISSPGVGSGLDVSGIISKLMSVEAQPLASLAKKEASFQAKISAYGSLSGALGAFQGALAGLSTPEKFLTVNASVADSGILSAAAGSTAAAGSYNVNVTQLAQAQTIIAAGQTSSSAAIGIGTSTTLNFQFGNISGGSYASSSTQLSSVVAAGGIGANSLSINGSTIVTSGATTSAAALATQINLLTGTTGVTAAAQATDSGVQAFTPVTTALGDSYSLMVGTTTLANIGGPSSLTAAQLDTAITTGPGLAGLTSDGITFTGSAVGGNLRFTRADGSNINIAQTLVNGSETATGGIAGLSSGTAKTYTSAVSLSSAYAITVAGSNPVVAGFNSGILPNTYTGATYTQDATQASATVTIDSTNNSLQGIRDAINKGNFGVTASIVSDGGSAPNHLVLTSNKTGVASSMKIAVSGDPALSSLLAYDPSGTQNLTQSSAAQNSTLTVNGIAVSSANQTVNEAIQGTVLTVNKLGATTVTVARDTEAVEGSVNSFVKAYNDLNKTISNLTAYDPVTRKAGLLLGDSSTRQIQSLIRRMMGSSLTEGSGSFLNFTQIGITSTKDGSLSLNTAKLKSAIATNVSDVGALFATVGKTSDSLISFVSSTSATKPGNSVINLSALASQGKVAGTGAAGMTITQDLNDQLSVTVDGVSASVTLLPGTYTASSLVSLVQSAINGVSSFSTAGVAVTVSKDDSNFLTITSNRYGSASNVAVGGNGSTNLMGATPASTAGADVAGTINGILATGSGKILSGAVGSSTEGLKLLVTGGSINARGTFSLSQGYATQLDQLINNFVGTSGSISSSSSGLNRSVKDIGTQRTNLNARLVTIEARYRAQFSALDTAIASMNQTTNYLTQQLTALSNMDKL